MLCESICKSETSRRAVEGTPSSSISSLVFFRATRRPVLLSLALYTLPYVPSPIFSSFSYPSIAVVEYVLEGKENKHLLFDVSIVANCTLTLFEFPVSCNKSKTRSRPNSYATLLSSPFPWVLAESSRRCRRAHAEDGEMKPPHVVRRQHWQLHALSHWGGIACVSRGQGDSRSDEHRMKVITVRLRPASNLLPRNLEGLQFKRGDKSFWKIRSRKSEADGS